MTMFRACRIATGAAAVLAFVPALLAGGQEPGDAMLEDSAADEVELPLDQVPAEIREQFSAALAELLADDWHEREEAETWLEESSVPDSVFEMLLQSRALAPEQEHRIVGVLRDRILDRQRGAMGIKMTTGRSPVQVIEVRPNMPARGRLQVGDTIIAIDGIAIATSTDLERVLASRQPGDVIDVTVRRRRPANPPLTPLEEEEALSVEITLTDDSLFTEEEQLARRQERVAKARELVTRYAPRATLLRVPEEGPPEIAELRLQISDSLGADEATRRALRDQWRATRDALLVATLASGITDAERQRRWEIYSAYVDLLLKQGVH